MSDVTADNLAARFLARLGKLSRVDVCDAVVLQSPTRPFVVATTGEVQEGDLRYCDVRPRVELPAAVMVVNNSPEGARLLARRVSRLLGDQQLDRRRDDGLYITHDFDGPLLTDDTVEGAWRYSITTYWLVTPDQEV